MCRGCCRSGHEHDSSHGFKFAKVGQFGISTVQYPAHALQEADVILAFDNDEKRQFALAHQDDLLSKGTVRSGQSG